MFTLTGIMHMKNCRIAVALATAKNIENIDRAYICMMFDRIFVSSYARAKEKHLKISPKKSLQYHQNQIMQLHIYIVYLTEQNAIKETN